MKINSFIIGDNSNDLFGCNNDSKLVYNIIYNYYLKYPNILNFPIINNLLYINISDNDIILFYFSGHSNKRGDLMINNKYYSCKDIINIFNKNNIIIFIIDSCYSEKFIINNNNIIFLVSSLKDQTSKEILVKYKGNYIDNFKYDKITHGVFTYYLVNIISNIKINNGNINDIEYIKQFIKTYIYNNPIWKFVEKKYSQNILYKYL